MMQPEEFGIEERPHKPTLAGAMTEFAIAWVGVVMLVFIAMIVMVAGN